MKNSIHCMGIHYSRRLSQETANRLVYVARETLKLNDKTAKRHLFNGHNGGIQFFEPRLVADVVKALDTIYLGIEW